ncbi:glycoprotein 3-alpha-L-fucosyltransferase A-like [Mytilus californianus]|uniref:glycoprotein 3-alpha-L-fucosyltransferase A-like n=1 Tax=Mytilus californianus TaxID=6549 RepID=UPI0022482F5D|nr:glycoprotein 3-alpha-L-fucosyltransferase A-like [Mytilus californianus]
MLWTLGQINYFGRADFNNIIKKQPQPLRTNASETYFTILFYAIPAWFNPKTVIFHECSYKNCKLITDKKLLSTSEAVIFHHNSFSTLPDKPRGQIWIFASLESPYHTSKHFNTEKVKGKFNWTMTYRKDSEAFSPYAFLKKQLHIPVKKYTSIFMNKTKNIAWVVSNCQTQSKRQAYVKELSKYIDVDIYGRCGKPCLFKGEHCKMHLSKTYRFYLSFENSLCKDYLTEKIFRMYSNSIDFIPIVRGAPNAKDHLPQKTYISTSDFQSPQKLAAFLKIIGSDKTRYISYLKEKHKYLASAYEKSDFFAGLCDICYHLNVGTQKPKTIDLNKWLWENQCHMPTDIHVPN